MMNKIAVVGNGSLGLYTAIQIKLSYPSASVHLFGAKERIFAASTAAGAMANVYAEMEHAEGYLHEVNKRYLEMGKFSSAEWKKFLAKTDGQNCITSNDTYIFLQNDPSSFENANFEAARKSAKLDGVLVDLGPKEIEDIFPAHARQNIEKAIKIIGEFSFSVSNLFNHLDKIASRVGVIFEDSNVENVILEQTSILAKSEVRSFDKILIMAGVNSHKIISDDNLIPLYQGVGVAMLLNPVKDLEVNKLRKGVFRSVNRGGAQCGIHFVPREDGKYYLGAGNYVSKIEEPVIRLDTIRYLLSTLEKDLIGRGAAYELTGEFVLGLRPRTLDGFPAIGELKNNKNVFVATGTNRAGLTWAPFVASQAIRWLENQELSILIKGWNPDRSPIMFGTSTRGIEYFVESRMSNSMEHGLISKGAHTDLLDSKRREFENTASLLAKAVSERLNLPENQTINPDNWAAILSE